MKIHIHSFGRAGPVKNNAERTFCNDRGIQMLQRSSGGISRICEERQARLISFLIQFFEAAFMHVNLAPHLENFGRRAA